MRKNVLLVAVVLVVALCLSACGVSQSQLDNISKLIQQDYSKVTLNVITVVGDTTLTGIYEMTYSGSTTTVNYDYYKLNELDMTGNNPSSYTSRVQGTVVIENGNIVSGDDSVVLPDELAFANLNFNKDFFNNAKSQQAKFEADVTNPSAFVQNSTLVCEDMHIAVYHTDSVVSKMEITYSTPSGAQVTVTYMFTK